MFIKIINNIFYDERSNLLLDNINYKLFKVNDNREIEKYLKHIKSKNVLNSKSKYLFNKLYISKIRKVVINMTDNCNLNCLYCYKAKAPDNLSDDVIQAFLNNLDKFESLVRLQFLGGEPLLFKEKIEMICRRVKQINNNISFYCTTNGTLIDKYIIDVINKYNIKLVLSVDGPKKIHDKLRPNMNGSGSYNQIIDNISKYGHYYKAIEATFTNYHVQNNISVQDLEEFLKEEFQTSNIFIAPAVDSSEKVKLLSLDKYSEYYNVLIKNIDNLFDKFKHDSINNINDNFNYLCKMLFRIFEVFINKKEIELLCPAGIETISIKPNGNCFPCYALEDTKYQIFNIKNFDKDSYFLNNEIFNYNSKNNKKCFDCFARPYCIGCIKLLNSIDNKFCEFSKTIVYTVFYNYSLLNTEQKKSFFEIIGGKGQ